MSRLRRRAAAGMIIASTVDIAQLFLVQQARVMVSLLLSILKSYWSNNAVGIQMSASRTFIVSGSTERAIESHPFVVKLLAHGAIDSEDMKALRRTLEHRTIVKKGQDIIVQGYDYNTLDIVESGFGLRYTLLHQGGRQIISAVLPGDIVGFPASFFDRSIFSVMAATAMSVHRISFESFTELCKQRTNIAIALIWYAAREASLYAHHLINASRRSPLERIAHFLLETHFRLKAVGSASEDSFDLPFSQESIGDAVGLSAPHVNRMLSELKHQGLITIGNRTVQFLDRTALQILAEFDPTYLQRTAFSHKNAQAERRNRPASIT